MHVECANCGEELMGSVNRCWRCGQRVVSTPHAQSSPPVRRASSVANTIESGDSSALNSLNASEQNKNNESATTGGDVDSSSEEACTATASPQTNRPPIRTAEIEPTHQPESSRHAAWKNFLAVAACLLGPASLVGCLFSAWFLLPAMLALIAGLCGLTGRLRALAIIGLIFACLSVTVGTIRVGYLWVENRLNPATLENPAAEPQLPVELD